MRLNMEFRLILYLESPGCGFSQPVLPQLHDRDNVTFVRA